MDTWRTNLPWLQPSVEWQADSGKAHPRLPGSQADLGRMGASRREETQVRHGDLVSREAVLSE